MIQYIQKEFDIMINEKMPLNLENIIKEGKGIKVEFKKAKDELPKNLFETICSMLNRNGGHIFLGINDDGKIIGVNPLNIKEMKRNFANLCNNPDKIFPTIHLDIKEYEIENKKVLYIFVNESSDVHNIKGRVYDRNEDGDYEITNNTSLIANLYLRKSSTYIENKIYPYATIDDLRSDIIAKVRQMAVNRYSKHPWGNMSDIELLKSASLYEKNIATGEEGINLAGILLFGRDEVIKSALSYYKTDAILRVENVDRYDDRDDIRTNLIDSYDRLMDFVIKHLNDKFYLEEDKRIDVRSKIAREICANMLIHREFSNPFPARLIITKDAIYTENANKPRSIGYIDLNNYVPYPKNPKIGNVFKEAGLADELGSGIRNIVKYTKIYSNNIPTFEDGDIFKVTIPLTSVYSRDEIKIKIYDFIASHDGVTRKEINNYIYPHLETNLTLKEKDNIVRYIITQLKNENKIVKEGMKSNVFWKKVD